MQLERSPIKMSQVVALRFNRLAFSQPLFQATDAARETIFQAIRDDVIQSKRPDDFVSWGYIDQLRAAFMMTWLPRPWEGAPIQRVFLETVPGDIEAEEWLVGEVARRHAAITDDLQFELFGHCPVMWRAFLEMGFAVDSVKLIGQPRAALDGLRAHYGTEKSLPDGIRFEPLSSNAQAEEVVALEHAIYAAEPHLCWYGANSRPLNSTRIDLRRRVVLGGDLCRLALDANDRIVGFFGAKIDNKSAYWGQESSLRMLVAPEYRRQGLGIAGYRFVLEALLEAGAGDSALISRAAHPAILDLGQRFGRTLHSVTLRRNPSQPHAVFSEWVV